MVFILAGCWFVPPKASVLPAPDDGLTDAPRELAAIGEQNLRDSARLSSLRVAVEAFDKLRGVEEMHLSGLSGYDVDWRLAKACFLAAEADREIPDKLAWIAKGEKAAERAILERPDGVEGYYYLAILKGRRAQHSGLGFAAMVLARRVEDDALKASELDPTLENGGPYRLLAMLYANAPPWPTSIGDIDKALEYANKAVELVDYPLNHLILAEVLIEDDEYDEARALLKRVMAAPKVGDWAIEGEIWRPHTMQLLKKLDEE